MILLRSLASAFLMYSKIPMPKVGWSDENRRYALCFFPLVGAVIGAVFLGWRALCIRLDIGSFLCNTVSVLIPILITGGIHFDGFCDVIDAVSSHSEISKKLEIMRDPHIGAFAVMGLVMYLILQLSLFFEIENFTTIIMIAFGFAVSRALSGLAAVTFKSAKSEGLLVDFARPAHRKITVITLISVIAICGAVMLFVNPVTGGSSIAGAMLSFAWYRFYSYRNFGGITGDLAGWFLQICEISLLIFAVIGEKTAGALAL